MARESIFIEEIRQAERPKFEVVESTHADVIVDVFMEVLRLAFENHPLYTYIPKEDSNGPDFDLTKIVIVDKYTEEAMFLPTITANFNSANTHWIQFSQSPFNTVLKPEMNLDGSIKRDVNGRMVPSHYEYVGAYDSSITFLISAQDTIEREELCNLLHVLLVESLRDIFLQRGIHVKTVSVGGQTEVPYRNDFIYQAPVTAEIYTEWKRKVPIGDTLKSIGFDMEVSDGSEGPVAEGYAKVYLPVYDLDTQFYVQDPATGNPVIPELVLSATSSAAPITLVYNTMTTRWEVSNFWKTALTQTLIPYANFQIELNKISPVQKYLTHAAEAIVVASMLRAIALSQGRLLPDGTKVINQSFIYEDGKVDLRGNHLNNDLLIYSTTVEADNTVVVRIDSSNKNRDILVAKNVVTDAYGVVQSGQIFKRIVDQTGTEVDIQLATADQDFLDGQNLNAMTAVDLFMIMQFATQPFRYSLSAINAEIDKLLAQLGDMSISITYRAQKIASITSIKQDLIDRTEKFLLCQPVGL